MYHYIMDMALVLIAYNINTFLIKGTNQTLQFMADKPGTFTFRCTSFCAFPDADPMNHFNMIVM